MPVIIIIILIITIIFLKRKADTFKEPSVFIAGISFSNVSIKNIDGKLKLLIQNNNKDDITITNADLSLYKGKYKLGNLLYDKTYTIKGKSLQYIDIPFNIKPDISIATILFTKDTEKIEGNISGYYGNIPFTLDISEPLRQQK